MKEQINEQLVLLEKELSKLKRVTEYIDDTKKSSKVLVSELREVQKNYSAYTEKIFNLYKISVEQLKKDTASQVKEGVIGFKTTGSAISQSNRELSNTLTSDLKEIRNNHASHMRKIYELYKSSLNELHKEIKDGTVNFKITGSKIDQTNREKLAETKNLIDNYRKIVEATNNLIKTVEAVDFPARLDAIEEKIGKNFGEISHRFNMQDKQNKTIKILLFTLLGLVGVGVAGAMLIWL